MRVDIKDPLSGLTGFNTIPLDIDRKWLKSQMDATGKSAKECISDELAKIPGIVASDIRRAGEINRRWTPRSWSRSK